MKEYQCYKCKLCNKSFILLSSEFNSRLVKCPYCSSKKVSITKETDDLREVIKERFYKRERGAIRQVK